MNKDLKWIKKHYSEKLAHLCRELFPTILETEGLLPKLLDSKFDHSKFLYDDLVEQNLELDFKNYIYSLIDVENNNELVTVEEPSELLAKVGYELYECKTEEDIQAFRKYYASDEQLCTFYGKRLDSCFVFFAVKKNVDEIKRENFEKPNRQDEYGTSVISIQFTRGQNNHLSIKNRYNHHVNNPDATFGNNLDNIIEGLGKSFEQKYNLHISNNYGGTYFEMNNYVCASDGKFYKYNYEIANVYYCPNNIIIRNFKAEKLESRYIILDYNLLDLKEKKISSPLSTSRMDELFKSFTDSINSCGKISKIVTSRDEEKNTIVELYIDHKEEPIKIKINKFGVVIGYINNYVEHINDCFLLNNEELEEISLNRCKTIGTNFMYHNNKLGVLYLPDVEIINNGLLYFNQTLKTMCLPNLKNIKGIFLTGNNVLEDVYMPNAINIEEGSYLFQKSLKRLVISNSTNIDGFRIKDKLERFSDKIIYVDDEESQNKTKKLGEYN